MSDRETIYDHSEAWRRLNHPLDPNPEKILENLQRVKHDVVTVLQTVISSIADVQHHEHQRDEEHRKLKSEHYELVDRLFSYEDGAFVKVHRYVDAKTAKVYVAAIGIGCSLITASVLLALNVLLKNQ